MNRAGSTSPGLMLLPHPIADQVHGPMQRGRNNDDGEEAEDRVGQGPASQATPRLAVPEDPLPIGELAAEVDRRTSAEDDRHRVREEGGEEEPEGLGDRLEGHRAIERETCGYR